MPAWEDANLFQDLATQGLNKQLDFSTAIQGTFSSHLPFLFFPFQLYWKGRGPRWRCSFHPPVLLLCFTILITMWELLFWGKEKPNRKKANQENWYYNIKESLGFVFFFFQKYWLSKSQSKIQISFIFRPIHNWRAFREHDAQNGACLSILVQHRMDMCCFLVFP